MSLSTRRVVRPSPQSLPVQLSLFDFGSDLEHQKNVDHWDAVWQRKSDEGFAVTLDRDETQKNRFTRLFPAFADAQQVKTSDSGQFLIFPHDGEWSKSQATRCFQALIRRGCDDEQAYCRLIEERCPLDLADHAWDSSCGGLDEAGA